jgi:predicted helicase
LNENENNKNREYPEIDKRIKDTYIKHSTAQKTKLYDMYTRFYRWATDRLQRDGIIAFITNRSFLYARGYDGFRKVVADEFSHIYIVDLGGGVNRNPQLSGPKHNVFAIKTGVAIGFMVRKKEAGELLCQIFYARRPEMELAVDKLRFLATTRFDEVLFQSIKPSKRNYWVNLADNDWDELLPAASKASKQLPGETGTIFRSFALGASTNRDEWAIDYSVDSLSQKLQFFIHIYAQPENAREFNTIIKWSRNLKRRYDQGLREEYNDNNIKKVLYRPYCKFYLYDSELYVDERGAARDFFVDDNIVVAFTNPGSEKPFITLVADEIPDLHLTGAGTGAQCLPLYRYDDRGQRVDNITDWALAQFRAHYAAAPRPDRSARPVRSEITKQDIFHYVYAVLHHPAYREKYRLNLKQEFPRIPFYDDFWQWAGWGRQLMDLHLHYETITPYPLESHELDPDTVRQAYKAKLRANLTLGTIELDTYTTLSGIPPQAWDYKLGNRSALEWILDRYKERTPRDPTIREKFNTYRFADYKEQVVDLIGRVTTVSVETMKIIEQMPAGEAEG